MTFSIGPFGAPVGIRLPPPSALFNGDPNVFVSSIDVSGGIVATRTSGTWPFAVQVSASAITAVGSLSPYEELDYSWNFGDLGTPRFTTNQLTGLPENMNTQQTGPEAAYIYDGSGSSTRTCTLTVKARSIIGAVLIQTVQIIFTIADKAGAHVYYNSNVVGGDGSGSSPANASTSATTLATSFISGHNIHIAQGSTFTLSNGSVFRCGGSLHVDTYDSGNGNTRPFLTSQSVSPAGTQGTLFIENQFGGNKDDIYIKGIQFSTNDGTAFAWRCYFQQGTDVVSNVFFDDCVFTGQLDKNADDSKQVKWGFWNCQSTPQVITAGISNGWMLGSATQWLFFVGCQCVITGSNVPNFINGFDHWLYPGCNTHSLYRNCFWDRANVSYSINTNSSPPSAGGTDCPYHLIAGCKMMTDFAFDASNSANSLASIFSKFVAQGCAFNVAHCPTFFFGCDSMTIRDCNNWGNNQNQFVTPAGQLDNIVTLKIYRNKYYSNHNFLGLTGGPWTKPHRFTDNIVYTTSTSLRPVELVSSDWIASGALIDRNQYWAPNFSGHPNPNIFSANGGSSGINLAAWQALGVGNGTKFDQNGSYGDPHWIDPANGDFRVAA